MTTTPINRPTLQRKHTTSSEKKRDAALNTGVKLTIEGVDYEVRVGDVTPPIARELRKHADMGFMSLMQAVGEDPDIDVISAFVWVARRLRGELIDFDDVVIDYAAILSDGFDVELAGAATEEEADASNPEA